MNHQSMMAAHLANLTPIVKSKTANKRQRVGSNTCLKCDVTLKQEQECISCCVCELNFCIECTNILPALLSALKEDTTQNLKWTCNGCKQNFPCMTGLSQQLKTIEEKTHSRISKIERKMEDINTDIGFRVKNEVASLKTGLVDEVKTEIKSSLQDEVKRK